MTTSVTEETAIALDEVSKVFPAAVPHSAQILALSNVTFSARRGSAVGVVGCNGSGKSTLLRIITGALSPSSGECRTRGRIAGIFSLGAGFQDELSGRENVFLHAAMFGLSRSQMESRMPEVVAFSELGTFIDMPLGTYSQGMRMRLAFSIFTVADFDIGVIDEVLAVGDVFFQDKCYRFLEEMKRAGRTLVLVSQSPELAARFADTMVLLNRGNMEFFGEPQEAVRRYYALRPDGPGVLEGGLLQLSAKRWSEDRHIWGTRLGTGDARISAVSLRNRFGLPCRCAESGSPLTVQVRFQVRSVIRFPHFGVALFRQDGVYCYGPNTSFDGLVMPELLPGDYFFRLSYRRLLCAPGDYVLSLAVWDRDEQVAYDYCPGHLPFKVIGEVTDHQLLSIPCEIGSGTARVAASRKPALDRLFQERCREPVNQNLLSAQPVDDRGWTAAVFITGRTLRIRIVFDQAICQFCRKETVLYAGLLRGDGILCFRTWVVVWPGERSVEIVLPYCALLPGEYLLSLAAFDLPEGRCLAYAPAAASIAMGSRLKDHGTVYLEHRWRWGRLSR